MNKHTSAELDMTTWKHFRLTLAFAIPLSVFSRSESGFLQSFHAHNDFHTD